MPRKALGAYAQQDKQFQGTLAKYKTLAGLSTKDVAKVVGIPQSTFYAKVSTPGRLTVDEMRKIVRYFRFTATEIEGLFR